MVPQRRSPWFVLAFSLLLGPASARAADAWPVARGPSREPAPYRYEPKVLKEIPKDFLEDSAACILYAGNTYFVEADGTIETITHDVTRLNGRKGIDKLGEYRNITYDPGLQKLTLNVARLHKADGKVVDVKPAHLHLRDVSTDYQVYDKDKQLIISFPSLEVGDVLEVKWTVRGKNPEHGGRFFTRYTFGDATYPVVLDELRVRLPKDMPFKWASVVEKIAPVVEEKDGQRTYHWKKNNCQRPSQDENLPLREELRPSVACSTFATWEDVGKWKQKLRNDCWTCTEEVGNVVREVTKGLTDPTAKARALTYWVRRNVRYVSSGEKHDFTPHPPGTVLSNRYGDCKDTSQLLAVMLAEAGIQVELATLGVQDDGQILESVPSPWGTHAILLVTIDGKQHWIDTTAALNGWDFLPHDDRDRLCYLVDRKGTLRHVRTPKLRAEDNRFEQVTELRIGADGSSRCERTMTSSGLAAISQRDNYLEVPVGERRRQVNSELQDSNSRTRLLGLRIDETALKDFDRPVATRIAFEIGGHFTGSPDREGSVTDSKVWAKILAYNLDYDRQTPMVYYAPFESEHRYIIYLPPAYTLESLPRDKTIKSAWGEFKLTVKTSDKPESVRKIELLFQTRLHKVRIEPADFDAFRKFQEDLTKGYRVWMTLKPATELADAPLLEALLYWTPSDAGSAAALARLYQQHNKLDEARRVLKTAAQFSPDDAALWELAVKCAEGAAEEEAAQRELVKRFPEESKYSLALASILIGANKQDEARVVLAPLAKGGTASIRAQAHYQLARSYYRKDDLKTALKHLDDALKADPETVNTVKAHHLRGQLTEELGKPKEAVQAYQLALGVDPNSDETLEALIRLEIAQKHETEALGYLRRYVLAVGSDHAGLLKAAEFYYRMEHFDEAFEVANRAREIRFHERAQRILGLVLLRRAEYTRAVFHLDKAELDAVVAEALLRADIERGDLRDLANRVEQAKTLKTATPALQAALTEATQLLKRRADLVKELPTPDGKAAKWKTALDALALAERAHRVGAAAEKVQVLLAPALAEPEMGAAFALQARLALERGKLSAALTDAEKAIRHSPSYAIGWYVRGRVRQERGDNGALSDLKRAVELGGKKDGEMLHYLAEALYKDGQHDAALTAQRLAVKLRPADKEILQQLQAFEKAGSE